MIEVSEPKKDGPVMDNEANVLGNVIYDFALGKNAVNQSNHDSPRDLNNMSPRS